MASQGIWSFQLSQGYTYLEMYVGVIKSVCFISNWPALCINAWQVFLNDSKTKKNLKTRLFLKQPGFLI
jgi:hypothetical protein